MRVGFIGTGNMGSAIAISASKYVQCDFYFANRTIEKAKALQEKIGGTICDNHKVAKECDLIFLCVEPQQATDVLKEIKEDLESNKQAVLVSIMTAWTIERIKNIVNVPVIRTMPNTPLKINAGIMLYDFSKEVSQDKIDLFLSLMDGSGLITKLDEKYIDAASTISGCAPAYTDMYVDALVCGVEQLGIDRQLAIKLGAQMLIGTGKLMLESGKDPDTLKKEVCSPGGSTIEGIKVMEDNNLKKIMIDAVKASYEKNKKL